MYGDYLAFKARGDADDPAHRDREIIFVRKERGPPAAFVTVNAFSRPSMAAVCSRL
jgi:hypothetical protein